MRAVRSHVAILGGGHGVASVLRALRDPALELTVIVTVADDGGSSGELRRRWGGAAVGDMRRSLIVLAGQDGVSARALARPLTIGRLGEHPLGNLVLRSLANAFGDLETASDWLCTQLGIFGRVLPATAEPVSLVGAAGEELIRGESAISAAGTRIRALSFEPVRPKVPSTVIDAITHSDWVLLAPGSLFTSMLAVSALPDIRSALSQTAAHVLWICNLEPGRQETAGMSAADHLAAIRSHGVRVDAVLLDPSATLHFAREQLAAERLELHRYPLQGAQRGIHDPVLLSAALQKLFSDELVFGERTRELTS